MIPNKYFYLNIFMASQPAQCVGTVNWGSILFISYTVLVMPSIGDYAGQMENAENLSSYIRSTFHAKLLGKIGIVYKLLKRLRNWYEDFYWWSLFEQYHFDIAMSKLIEIAKMQPLKLCLHQINVLFTRVRADAPRQGRGSLHCSTQKCERDWLLPLDYLNICQVLA